MVIPTSGLNIQKYLIKPLARIYFRSMCLSVSHFSRKVELCELFHKFLGASDLVMHFQLFL